MILLLSDCIVDRGSVVEFVLGGRVFPELRWHFDALPFAPLLHGLPPVTLKDGGLVLQVFGKRWVTRAWDCICTLLEILLGGFRSWSQFKHIGNVCQTVDQGGFHL